MEGRYLAEYIFKHNDKVRVTNEIDIQSANNGRTRGYWTCVESNDGPENGFDPNQIKFKRQEELNGQLQERRH
jgi:hypothetical protein